MTKEIKKQADNFTMLLAQFSDDFRYEIEEHFDGKKWITYPIFL
jgi:hypothetical protein